MSFGHSDGILIITPVIGLHIGQPKRLLAVEEVAFAPGGKASYGKGFEQTPYTILAGAAEPKLELKLSAAREAWEVNGHVGGINGDEFIVSHVFQRPFVPTIAFLFTGCILTDGGGYTSNEGSGVNDKLTIMLKDARINGKSIYAKRYPL